MYDLHHEYARTIQRERLAVARDDARYRTARRGAGPGGSPRRRRRGLRASTAN
jgi:hypothetical protein